MRPRLVAIICCLLLDIGVKANDDEKWLTSNATMANTLTDSVMQSRRLTQAVPWELLQNSENFCEIVEDGCIQTVGFPNSYKPNGSCRFHATSGGYIKDVLGFQMESNVDYLVVNNKAYTGLDNWPFYRQEVVFGSIESWSDGANEEGTGWKICPRASCSTFVCPDLYGARVAYQDIPCAGPTCTTEADLDRCCLPKCTFPSNMSGYVLANPSGCDLARSYTETDSENCRILCEGDQYYASGAVYEPACPGPGGTFILPPCAPTSSSHPPWSIVGSCERYSADCVQTASFPIPLGDVSGLCILSLTGYYLINITYLRTEARFDELSARRVSDDGSFENFAVSGVLGSPTAADARPFLLPPGENTGVHFSYDAFNLGLGNTFRICARPMCGTYVCPSGRLFDCDKVTELCAGLSCTDAQDDQRCCRDPTPEESDANLDVINGSNAFSMGCGATTTTTSTTTTTVQPDTGQLVGWVRLRVPLELQSNATQQGVVTEAWGRVVTSILASEEKTMWLFPGVSMTMAANDSALSWKIGYQVLGAGGPEPSPRPLSNLTAMLTEELLSSSLPPGSDPSVEQHVTSTGSLTPYSLFDVPHCEDFPGFEEFEIFCGPSPTNYGWEDFANRVGGDTGLWMITANVLLEQVLFGAEGLFPGEPRATEACCQCGGGTCQPGSFILRGETEATLPRFCAPCESGSFSDTADALECQRCPPGRQGSLSGALDCLECIEGTYSDVNGSTACFACELGSYQDEQAQTSCKLCPPGFESTSARSTCEVCPAGRFTDDHGVTECSGCQLGTYKPQGDVNCSLCAPGTYADETMLSACKSCPAGRASANNGSTSCSFCPLGFFSAELGQSSCDSCDPGRHAGSEGQSTCRLCDTGSVSPGGQAECDWCPVGTFAAERGMSACELCSSGRFAGATRLDDCTDCGVGEFAAEDGLSECTLCSPGRFNLNTGQASCRNCSTGFFQGAFGSTSCVSCPAGSFAEGEGQALCEVCPRGEFSSMAGERTCAPCEAGMYADVEGSQTCKACSAGNYSMTFGRSTCAQCSPGTFTPLAGMSTCLVCVVGRAAAEAGSTECAVCASGSFAPAEGQSACIGCASLLPGPAEYWTTMKPVMDHDGETNWVDLMGASSLGDCGCRPGTQPDSAIGVDLVRGGTYDVDTSRGHGCVRCGEGLRCLGMGQLRIASSYSWDHRLSVYDCNQAIAAGCPGGLPGVCKDGRDPKSPACAECLPGKAPSDDGSCKQCTGGDYAFPIASTSVALVFIAGAYCYLDRFSNRRLSRTYLQLVTGAGQLMMLIQQLGVLSAVRVQWHISLEMILEWAAKLAFVDIDLLLRPQCIMDTGPVLRYFVRIIVPVSVVCIICCTHVVSQLLRRRKSWRIPDLFCSLGTLVLFFFVMAVVTALSPLQCDAHPNGSRTVSWFPSVLCWDSHSEHLILLSMSVFPILVPLAFISLCTWAVMVFKRKLFERNSKFMTAFSFMVLRYRSAAYWFGPFLLLRNLIFSSVPIFVEPLHQIIMLYVVMQVSTIVLVWVKPWRVKAANLIDTSIHVLLLFLVMVAATYLEDSPGDALAGISAVFSVLVFGGVLLVITYMQIRKLCCRNALHDFFLSFNRVETGCLAHLLKIRLGTSMKRQVNVFFDVEIYKDLDKLLDVVAFNTRRLLFIHSPEVLSRMWCLGELTIAHAHRITIFVVKLPNARPLSLDDAEKGDLGCLIERNISIPLIKEALSWAEKDAWAMQIPLAMDGLLVDALVRSFVENREIPIEGGPPLGPLMQVSNIQEVIAILADVEDCEAVAASLILHDLLRPSVTFNSKISVAVTKDRLKMFNDQNISGITSAIVMCTPGLFNALTLQVWAQILLHGCPAGFVKVCIHIPLPSSEQIVRLLGQDTPLVQPAEMLVKELKRNTMYEFFPGMQSQELLRIRAECIAKLFSREEVELISSHENPPVEQEPPHSPSSYVSEDTSSRSSIGLEVHTGRAHNATAGGTGAGNGIPVSVVPNNAPHAVQPGRPRRGLLEL